MSKRAYTRIAGILTALLLGLFACPVLASSSIDLSDSVDWFATPDAAVPISKIRDLNGQAFTSAASADLPQGFNTETIWLRFQIPESMQAQSQLVLLHPYALTDRIEFYPPESVVGAQRIGDSEPFHIRSLRHRYPAFSFKPEPGTYHLSVQSSGSLQLPLELMTPEAYVESVSQAELLIGLYHGMMLVLVLGSMVVYLMMREQLFLFYALYLLAHQQLQFTLNGLSFQYFWPDLPGWANVAPTTLVNMGILFAALFVIRFLETEQRTPVFHRVFQTLVIISVLSIPFALFGDYQIASSVATGSGIFLALASLAAGFSALHRGYRPARFLLLGWSAFLIGMVITGFVYSGLLPATGLFRNAMQIGSTLEVLILILALADRVSLARSEHDQAETQDRQQLLDANLALEEQVRARTLELENKNRQLADLASQDGLTGLLNHKFVLSGIEAIIADARRYDYPVALLMLDLDHFKQINDRLGHPVGDQVLLDVADTLRSSCRQSDMVGRYGGDEFIMALSHAGAAEAIPFAERLRLRINRIPVGNDHGTLLAMSVGIAIITPENKMNLTGALEAADQALYKAKFDGRNRIALAENELSLVGSS